MNKRVILKEGKEKSLNQRHPWIFSGAVASMPTCDPGEILPVYSSQGTFLAKAYFHPDQSLMGRVLSFQDEEISEVIKNRILDALILRSKLIHPKETNAYRLVHAEADGLPGLIVDNYNGYLVIQIQTYGMEKLRKTIVDILQQMLSPKAIYEKSLSHARIAEGLSPVEQLLSGKLPSEIEILENNLKFIVSVQLGQKTGFFIDQRNMRSLVQKLSSDRNVLNCFSYTGGFAIYALHGGAKKVTSIDSCKVACQFAEKNTLLNGFSIDQHNILNVEAFDYLKNQPIEEDFVILDPPAFAKKRDALENAIKGYRNLNALALSKMPPRSFLLTCSCSYYMDEKNFQKTLFQAAQASGRFVQIIQKHSQGFDHPISLYHPEGEYLKSFLLFVQ